jgi:hypothetical protein
MVLARGAQSLCDFPTGKIAREMFDGREVDVYVVIR